MDSKFINTIPPFRCEGKSENGLNHEVEDRSFNYSIVSALCMSGGVGDNSYSVNSLLQRRVLSKAKPILVKNTKELMMNLNFPKYIKVADLGCCSGQNTFLAMSEIINTINLLCQQKNQNLPEIDCCLNDLLNNDFNTTFNFVQFFSEKNNDETQKPYFVSGDPGSFYSRLFPRNSLHFIHSSYGLHWLSKVPEGLEKNKFCAYITALSPLSTYKAYLTQWQRDFTTFLKLRYEEMVCHGRMVLTFLGRKTIDNPLERDCCHFWTLLSNSLYDLVIEGLVSKSTMESLLVAHFGDAIINILFSKFAHHVSQHASCRNKTTVSLVVSLTRK